MAVSGSVLLGGRDSRFEIERSSSGKSLLSIIRAAVMISGDSLFVGDDFYIQATAADTVGVTCIGIFHVSGFINTGI